MAIRSNGNLLVHVRAMQAKGLVSGDALPPLPGYTLTPLVQPDVIASLVGGDTGVADHWLQAAPDARHLVEPHPWDQAHRAAQAADYAHFIEPDILHDRSVAPLQMRETADADKNGMDGDWPPSGEAGISPVWHLQAGFSGFLEVRATATGAGVRIAHLDTGYTPGHVSTPRHLRADLGWDFVTGTDTPVDPGVAHLLANAGHGTATLAILAGNRMALHFAGESYDGDFGGAPDAEVIPVRISESVVHIASSTMY